MTLAGAASTCRGVRTSRGTWLLLQAASVDLDWVKHVACNERYERPSEVDALIGDASKAEKLLGWKAQSYGADVAALDDELSGRQVRIDR